MKNFFDFSGVCIYQLLVCKEAARLGIIKEGEYENYVRYCLEKLTEQSKTKWRKKNENHRNRD